MYNRQIIHTYIYMIEMYIYILYTYIDICTSKTSSSVYAAPSKVNSSFFTRMRTALRMNFVVMSRISGAIVAEKRHTCTSGGRHLKMS